MLKTVIFDLDNTLCNTHESIVYGLRKTFEFYAQSFPNKTIDELLAVNEQAFNEIYSDPTIVSTSKPIRTWIRIYKIISKKLDLKELTEMIEMQKQETLKSIKLRPGIKNLLINLKQNNTKIGILTNGSFVEQAKKLVAIDAYSYIDRLITPDLMGFNKPDKRAYEYVMKDFNVTSEESIMVGNDVIDDLQGAKAIGMRAVLFTYKEYTKEKNQASIDYITHTVDELSAYLRSSS